MKQFSRENRKFIPPLVLIIFLYFTRLVNLTILPVFVDEAIYIRWAQVMRAEETLRFLPLSDGKQPLFMWVMIPVLKLFSDPLFAGRFLSVLCGLGTLIGVGILTFILFNNKKISLFASGIYAILPFAFFFDRMSLADSMLTMFGLWVVIFSYLTVRYNRLDFAMLGGFMLGGAWLTKSPALFFAILLPSFLIFSQKRIISSFYILVTFFIGYGFYNILRLGSNYHLIASRNMDYVYPMNHLLSSPFDPLKPFLLQSWQWIWMMAGAGLIGCFLIGIIVNFKKFPKQILLLSLLFLFPIVVMSEFAKVLTARYILFTLPYFVILSSLSFLAVGKNLKKVSAVALIYFIIHSVVFNFNLITDPAKANLPRSERSGYLEDWTAGWGIKEASEHIVNQHKKDPTKTIVVGTEGYFGTLPDGAQIYLNNYKNIIVKGVGLDIKRLDTSLVESKNSGNKTYLLVNDSRLNDNFDYSKVKLINSYPKAIRPGRTFETFYIYEIN